MNDADRRRLAAGWRPWQVRSHRAPTPDRMLVRYVQGLRQRLSRPVAVAVIMAGLLAAASQLPDGTGNATVDQGPHPYRSATPAEQLDHAIDVAIEAATVAEQKRGR
jgi:hypothetical protein